MMSVAKLLNVSLVLPDIPTNKRAEKDSSFAIVEMESDEDAKKLASRCFLLKYIALLECHTVSIEDMHETMDKLRFENPQRYQDYEQDTFRVDVEHFRRPVGAPGRIPIIERMTYLDFKGGVDLKNPKNVWKVGLDYDEHNGPLQAVFFGRLIGEGPIGVVEKFSLTKRQYIGTTSMDPLLSFVMANMVLAKPASLVYDPFVGTGSLLIAASHFGAFTMGSDIDGRQLRGGTMPARAKHQWKQEEKAMNFSENVAQYGLSPLIVDTWTCDITAHPLRMTREGWIDGIVTDPPYGVRAGARRIKSDPTSWREETTDKYPPTIAYENDEVLRDLLDFSARYLTVGGRLVFWLPTLPNVFSSKDVPDHPSLTMLYHTAQPLQGWDRILITMEKTFPYTSPNFSTTFKPVDIPDNRTEIPHAGFREWYFTTK